MRPSELLASHRNEICRMVAQNHVCNPRVFGSVLHGEDTEDSDLDLLVEPTSETTLFDIGAIQCELKKLLGITVDVLTPGALPDSFRELVMKEAVPV